MFVIDSWIINIIKDIMSYFAAWLFGSSGLQIFWLAIINDYLQWK